MVLSDILAAAVIAQPADILEVKAHSKDPGTPALSVMVLCGRAQIGRAPSRTSDPLAVNHTRIAEMTACLLGTGVKRTDS
jgi:hypothetical protein